MPFGPSLVPFPAYHVDKMSQLLYSRICEIAEVPDLESLRKELASVSEEMGFGLYSANVMEGRPGWQWRSFMTHNAPPAWNEFAMDVEDGRRDPVLKRLKQVSVPIVYNQSMYVRENCADLWEQQAVYGYKCGIVTAVHLAEGKHVFIGFDRPEPLPTDEAKLTRMLGDLQLLAVHAHEAVIRLLLPRADAEVSLTDRQLEVLRWIASGKTAWATGQILGLSERGVHGHLAKIYEKLNAGNQSQAVFNAAALGLM